ncbi:MAG TPA: NTP transferase domain-containing protein [Ilumatobacteraceae bacterium]|nr:NTP transferase domain-containing protein [Ilumatobacteraceae bacterium]
MAVERVAVLLAAGAGSRFTAPGHKLSAELPARGAEPAATVAERALAHVIAAEIGPVVVITGAAPDVFDHALPASVIVRHHPGWEAGQASTLRTGLAIARELGAASAVIGLADQPFVEPDAWRAVADAPGPIAVATYAGRRGNPVKLDAAVWGLLDDLAVTHPDEGARALMRVRPDLVCEVPCTGSPADIDTEEDLRRWQNS